MSSSTMTTRHSTQSNSTKSETAKRIGDIIIKARLAKGWNLLSEQDQTIAVAAWLDILNAANVPAEYLGACYARANAQIQKQIAEGREPLEMSANLLAAQWVGSLRDEVHEKNLAKKQLLANPCDGCPRCLGNSLGREYAFDEATGRILGMKGLCTHSRLESHEFLYNKHGGDPRDQTEEINEVEIF